MYYSFTAYCSITNTKKYQSRIIEDTISEHKSLSILFNALEIMPNTICKFNEHKNLTSNYMEGVDYVGIFMPE